MGINLGFIGFFFKHSKEIGLALEILGLIKKTVDSIQPGQKPNVAEISRRVYKLLPGKFKAPDGPATEMEFIDVIYKGCEFYLSIKSVFSK